MVSDFVFGAVLTLGTTLILILASVIGWLVTKVWQVHNTHIPEINDDIQQLQDSYFGIRDEGGHREDLQSFRDQLDEIHNQIAETQEKQEQMHREVSASHADVGSDIKHIVDVLEEHGLNGDLPDMDDREYMEP